MNKHVNASVLIVSMLAGLAAEAQVPDDEVVVVGYLEETTPQRLAELGNRIEVISAEDIRLGGFDDLAQTLQMRVPGLYLAPKNGAFDYMGCSLQGSRCQDILWLIDGVRINNRLYNTTAPLDTVPAHMIERIEILYGGQGIFYGTQAVAGVVNIVTKSFSDETTGSVGLGADDNNGLHFNGDLRGSYGRHSYVLYGSIDEAAGFQPFADGDYQPSGTDRDRGYNVRTLGLRYGSGVGDSGRVTLHYHHTDNRVEWAAPSNRARSFNERDEDLLTLKYDATIADDVAFYVKAYYHDWASFWTRRDNELDANGTLTGNVITVSDREFWGYEDYGLTAVADLRRLPGLNVSLGYEHQRYSGRDDVLLIADRTERIDAIFAQVRTTEDLFERSKLAVGVRHNEPSGDGDITVWNVSGRHDFTSSFYLRGTMGTAFRAPDAWQLYGNDPCCTQGNPDLEGEESRNFNLAIGGRIDAGRGVVWELTGFVREVDDLIGSENGVRLNTSDRVEFEGIDATISAELSSEWSVGLNYTLTRAEIAGSSEQIDEVPESLFKARIDYAHERLPLEIGATLNRVGEIFDSVAGGIGRVEHGGYEVLDLAAAWYAGDDLRHRFGLRIENALDEDYGTSLGRAFRDADGSSYAYTNLGTPRTVHVSYRYSF